MSVKFRKEAKSFLQPASDCVNEETSKQELSPYTAILPLGNDEVVGKEGGEEKGGGGEEEEVEEEEEEKREEAKEEVEKDEEE